MALQYDVAQVHERGGKNEEPEFHVVNPPATPLWRNRRYLRRQAHVAKTKPILMGLSSASAVCLLLPDRFEYSQAISFQLAQGSWSARGLFVLMFATLVYVATRFWAWRRYGPALFSTLLIGLLGLIALTDPRSVLHNGTFIGLTVALVVGHVYCWLYSTDGRVLLTGLACLVSAAICPFNLGLAERIMICSACLTLNVVILEYLD